MGNSRLEQFEKDFIIENPALVYDVLIYKLHEERSASWSITSIKNYLSVAYIVTSDYGGYNSIINDLYLFNTGLETNHQSLYCIGEEDDNDKKRFMVFLTKKEIKDKYKLNDEDFTKLKSPKEYLAADLIDFSKSKEIRWPDDNYDEEYLNKRVRKPESLKSTGMMHIIIDNYNRLPSCLLKEIIEEINKNKKDDDSKIKCNYKNQIQKAIWDPNLDSKEREYIYITIKTLLERAKDYAVKLSEIENDIIVPFFYVKKGAINYAIPLYLSHQDKPDLALAFDENGKIHTTLTIEQLRLNVRVIEPNKHYKWLS